MRRIAPFVTFTALAVSLSCSPDQTSAPLPELLLKQQNIGNPDCQLSGNQGVDQRSPVGFLCAIEIPGNPLTSSQKGWVEQHNGMYYLSDASNNGVDVIDIATHTYVGRVGGFVGNVGAGGGTATTNGAGPNSFTSAPARGMESGGPGSADNGSNRLLWVSDGNSTVRVVDMNSMQVIASISTAIDECDGGTATTHYCGRSNEIGYDPVHHVILVSNPSALDVATPHTGGWGFATFISASAPFEVLGHIRFLATGNVEGHVWVPEMGRFILPIQPTNANQATRGTMYHAVINAGTLQMEEKRDYYCPDIPGTTPTSTGNNNLQLADQHNLWSQMCGRPIRIDVRTGEILQVVTQISTGDQDWYNPGDGNFYLTGTDATTGLASLGVMDGRGGWLQSVTNINGASPSAYAKTNEIFTRALASATANSRCAVKTRGCVVVFAHTGS